MLSTIAEHLLIAQPVSEQPLAAQSIPRWSRLGFFLKDRRASLCVKLIEEAIID